MNCGGHVPIVVLKTLFYSFLLTLLLSDLPEDETTVRIVVDVKAVLITKCYVSFILLRVPLMSFTFL